MTFFTLLFFVIDGRTFLTVLARYDVRVSLAKVADLVTSHGALLDPYPDFSWFQDNGNCSQIIAARSIVVSYIFIMLMLMVYRSSINISMSNIVIKIL